MSLFYFDLFFRIAQPSENRQVGIETSSEGKNRLVEVIAESRFPARYGIMINTVKSSFKT